MRTFETEDFEYDNTLNSYPENRVFCKQTYWREIEKRKELSELKKNLDDYFDLNIFE